MGTDGPHKGVSSVEWAAFVLLAGLMFLLSWHVLTSIYQDIGRHLTIGRLIWESGTVPRTNLFSYTAPDFPFIDHHWLGEVLFYLGERAVGLKGLIALKAVLLASAFSLALAAAFRRTVLMPALLVGLVGTFIMAERTDVRPEVFSFLFLGWFLFVLYRAQRISHDQYLMTNDGAAKAATGLDMRHSSFLLWSLPFVQLLWVNTHIYFFMGPFLFLAFAVQRFVEMRKDKSQMTNGEPERVVGPSGPGIRRLAAVGAAIAGATLLNPWGIRGALYPFFVFGNYGYSIVENRSYFFLRAFGYPAATFSAVLAGIVLVAISFALNRRRIRENIMGLMLAGGTAALSFAMVRNYPLFGLVMMPVTLRNLSQADLHWRRRGFWALFAILVLLMFSTVRGQLLGYLAPGSRQFGPQIPAGYQQAVDFYRQTGLRGPVFNNFDIGSFLIWKLPEEKVFIDGRPEAYPAEFIQETYIGMQESDELWKAGIEKYGLNVIIWNVRDITPWSRVFLARLEDDPEWVPVYGDGTIGIWARDVPENAVILERLGLTNL